ncbi:MAG: helix-turn-helix domain-containing protein [Brevundimonas sp.]|nr:helix-turn-helix domain-containing protein [Brevundimonas sp.]
MSPGLSARQEECLRLTAFLTDKEIAARLGLSEATVKKHVHEACRRLGVNRRKAALALLERNVPGDTKDPIGEAAAAASPPAEVREATHEYGRQPSSALDVGGSGGGAGRVWPFGSERSGEGASHARAGGGRRTNSASRVAAAGAERRLGDGPDGRTGRRLGYRPPPGGRGVRLLILLALVFMTAALLKAAADLVVAYAEQAGEIGRITRPAPSARDARAEG